MRRSDEVQLLDDRIPGDAAQLCELAGELQPAYVPTLHSVGKRHELGPLGIGQRSRFAPGDELVVALPNLLGQPLLDLLEEMCLRWRATGRGGVRGGAVLQLLAEKDSDG